MGCMLTGSQLLHCPEMICSSVSSEHSPHLKFLPQSAGVLTVESPYAYFIDEEMERQSNTNA